MSGGIPRALVPYDPFRYIDSDSIALLSDLPFINVQSSPYNAVGNGLLGNDDTAAFQAAILAAQGKTLFIPFTPLGYNITSTLTVPFGLSIVGSNVSAANGTVSSPRILHNFDGTLFLCDGSFGGGDTTQGAGLKFENLLLHQQFGNGGAAGTPRGAAIRLVGTLTPDERAYWVRIHNVSVEPTQTSDPWTWGLDIDGSARAINNSVRDMWLSNGRFLGCGININRGENLMVRDFILNPNGVSRAIVKLRNKANSIFLHNVTGDQLDFDDCSNSYVRGGRYNDVTIGSSIGIDVDISPDFIANLPTINGNVSGTIGCLWQSFVLHIMNTAGTIQHAFYKEFGNNSLPYSINKLASPSATLTNTISVDSTTAFANGGGIDAGATSDFVLNTYRSVTDTGVQFGGAMTATVEYDDRAAASARVTAQTITKSLNVNGITQARTCIRLRNGETGATFAITTANIPAGKSLAIRVQGYLR